MTGPEWSLVIALVVATVVLGCLGGITEALVRLRRWQVTTRPCRTCGAMLDERLRGEWREVWCEACHSLTMLSPYGDFTLHPERRP